MKVNLLFEANDIEQSNMFSHNGSALVQDLELDILCQAMAMGDKSVYQKVMEVILSGLTRVDAILYRQEILKDCIENESVVRNMYKISMQAIESRKKHWWIFGTKYPSSMVSSAVATLKDFMMFLRQLRTLAGEHNKKFVSKGFLRLFLMLEKELDDQYFNKVYEHLQQLELKHGIFLEGRLGKGNKGTRFILRKTTEKNEKWIHKLFGSKPAVYTFHLHPRDESGARFLRELADEGLNTVANVLTQSTDHILNFFTLLRDELTFYIGCLNLYEQLIKLEAPVIFPVPDEYNQKTLSFNNLYDICLTLSMKQRIVGNDLNADGKSLIIITGANQGGKTTFLKSIGVSQLMMQCGMFVPASNFKANICDAMFTHFKREEDSTMKSGKLDEELVRMRNIADRLTTNSILLFNESFAATNEREGSEIGRQIVNALLENGIKVFIVTHLFDFANSFYLKGMDDFIFLRAERKDDGTRTFRLPEGKPLQTSYGEDLYDRIFENKDIING